MIIAVNTGLAEEDQETGDFIIECFSRLAKNNLQHRFIFIFSRSAAVDLSFSDNVTIVTTAPATKNTLAWKYWYDYKLPALLKKYKADIFIGINAICQRRVKLPQYLFIPGVSFLQDPRLSKKTFPRFMKRMMIASAEKAKLVLTTSAFSRAVIMDTCRISAEKTGVVRGGVDGAFKPAGQPEKESVKEKYTEGKEYFFCSCNDNLINLLKAFSFFKKRQKSNMLLIIAGRMDEQFRQELGTYKFRNEVKLVDGLPKKELAELAAAAYIMVHPARYDSLGTAALQAMQCGTPVVCSNAGVLPELCGDAALYFNPGDFEDMAAKMMMLFKDEDQARQLVAAGKKLVRQYDWDKTAASSWQNILRSVND